MNSAQEQTVSAVRMYWNTHTLGLQYVKDSTLAPGVSTSGFGADVGAAGIGELKRNTMCCGALSATSDFA